MASLVTRKGSYRPHNPGKFKDTKKSDSKVTFGAPAEVTQKLLKSDSKQLKRSKKSLLVTFESLLSNF